jgi:ribosomal protein S13
MVESTQEKVLGYVIEHFEEELSDWTLSEYVHMVLVLAGVYGAPVARTKSQLIITNFPFVNRLKAGELKEDELHTLRNTERFVKIATGQSDAFSETKVLVSTLSF